MTRPTRITVNAGDNSWESQLNTNLQQLYDRPLPPLLHAGTLANLESTRPAAQYQYCIAVVDYDGAGTPGQHMAFSNGTAWKLASNWELFQRRTFRSTAGAISVADIDDTIVCTGGASFAVTLPAISDANEGRVIRIKQNGTGTVTVTPTGDTIDGAANKAMSTQYDGFEFISDGTGNWQIMGGSGSGGGAAVFTSLTDTPANYTGAAGKRVRVNSTPDALEFIADTFLTLSDTPAGYGSATLKAVRVNAGETALEFYTPAGGVTDFTDLGDVPANYTGDAGKTVKVNSGETALEFVETASAIGQQLKHLSRGHVVADADQTLTAFPGVVLNLPTLLSSYGTAVTWDSVNKEFDINEDGTYMVFFQMQTQDASSHNTSNPLQVDYGAGWVYVEQSTSICGFAPRNAHHGHAMLPLTSGDKLRVLGSDLSSVAPVAIEGTQLTVVKLEVSIGAGGDMEVFQQGLDAAETFALSSGAMATVDLQSSIINNATDLFTFTAGTDVVTLNEAGTYLISYTISADDTTPTLTTAAKLQKDIGAGFVDIDGSQSYGGGADKFSHGNTVLIELVATDEIRLQAQDITGDGNCVAGTMLRIVRLKRGSDSIDYSGTTPEKTGRKWHDGKEIWRVMVLTAGAVASGLTNHAHGIASIDRVVKFWGHLKRDDVDNGNYPIDYGQLGAEVISNVDDTNLVIAMNAVYTGAGNTLSDLEAVIEYTI